MTDHLDKGNIHENQHGFPAKRSCESQLLMTTVDIATYLSRGSREGMGILYFSKAFDKVPHIRLSQKLNYYGTQSTTRAWITNFLTYRQQEVVVDNTTSNTIPTSFRTIFEMMTIFFLVVTCPPKEGPTRV